MENIVGKVENANMIIVFEMDKKKWTKMLLQPVLSPFLILFSTAHVLYVIETSYQTVQIFYPLPDSQFQAFPIHQQIKI